MKLKLLSLTLSIIFISGCSSKYGQNTTQVQLEPLEVSRGVVISVPKDGSYGNILYNGSGKMTADVFLSSFSKYAHDVEITKKCHGLDCLEVIDTNKYDYYVKPIILHWEDRATEWSDISDKVEIKVIVYNIKTKKVINNSSFTGESKFMTLGGDHPQDLLQVPSDKFVGKLYK